MIAIEAVLIALSLARMSRWSKPLFSKEVAPLFVGGTILGIYDAATGLLRRSQAGPGEKPLAQVNPEVPVRKVV